MSEIYSFRTIANGRLEQKINEGMIRAIRDMEDEHKDPTKPRKLNIEISLTSVSDGQGTVEVGYHLQDNFPKASRREQEFLFTKKGDDGEISLHHPDHSQMELEEAV